jgi:hypothetical protein
VKGGAKMAKLSDQISEREHLAEEVIAYYQELEWSQKLWSLAYHGTLYTAAIFSFILAIVVQYASNDTVPIVKWTCGDLAKVLAPAGAFLTAIATHGGFYRKWRGKRITRAKLRALTIGLEDKDVDVKEARDEYKRIVIDENAVVAGEKEPEI